MEEKDEDEMILTTKDVMVLLAFAIHQSSQIDRKERKEILTNLIKEHKNMLQNPDDPLFFNFEADMDLVSTLISSSDNHDSNKKLLFKIIKPYEILEEVLSKVDEAEKESIKGEK